ncbi:MAG: sulfatase family protein [Bryobacteraceae bacterium]
MTRRDFVSTTALSAASLAAAQRGRRNVLVFMSDQESARLPGPANLPNRKRLEAAGTRFTHAFCNTPQCSPARSALLTGLEPHRTGVLTNVDGGSLGKALPESPPTIGSVFQQAGYVTGYFGKWRLGGAGLARFGFATSQINGSDREISRRAAGWIRGRREPWLAWVSVLDPHHIYDLPKIVRDVAPRPGVEPPRSRLDNLEGKPREQRAFVDEDQGRATRDFTPGDWIRYRSYYLQLVEKVDACLGAVLSAIPDFDTTIIAYTSDHGDALGEHGLPFKGPFMYDELVRIPLTVTGTGRGERHDLTTQADLAPMLASRAGVTWPRQAAASRDAVFLEYYSKQKWVNPIRTVRTQRWKLNLYDSGARELYDLAADPYETRNLSGHAAERDTERRLASRLDAWRAPLTQPKEKSK